MSGLAKSKILADLLRLPDDPTFRSASQDPSKLHEALLERYRSLVNVHIEQQIHPGTNAVTKIVMQAFLKSAFLKSAAFRAENEWRIVMFSYGPPAEIQFRPGQSSLIPYIAISLPLGPAECLIRRVVVGPSPRIDEAVESAKLLLKSGGYKIRTGEEKEGIDVVPSNVPFRNW